ncbi:hypothetical protein P148_SR1C00001G0590 [candidate division SR1 bacterium RAAC1_SR1_1]|nr:hypothetical protein P148_SR1C00001G0590 [candidate division SR1 bacterium RAAC1_SR1_1]
MFRFLWDFLKYPFDAHKEINKFSLFLEMLLKQYPAVFWIRPTFKKILALPLLIIYFVFRTKKK